MVRPYLDALRRTTVRPLAPGETQSHEGGIVHEVDPWARLARFLVTGSEGTYYVGARELTLDNLNVVRACLAEDPVRTVDTVVEISRSGRAPKNDPAILALAVALRDPDVATRRHAASHLADVCRTGTHLLHAAAYLKALAPEGTGEPKTGEGPGSGKLSNRVLRRAFGDWFLAKTPEELAYQAIKYPSRDGWALRDVLRQASPKPTPELAPVLRWIAGKGHPEEGANPILLARDALYAEPTVEAALEAIRRHRLPREALPTGLLNSREVWDALLAEMPLTAMIRNLAKMTAVGLLTEDRTNASVREVVDRLGDEERLRAARVHPIALLAALNVYEQGHGERGSLTWTPVKRIVNALDEAFYLAFGNVEPSGKRVVLALDVSASMDGSRVNGMPLLSAREASAAMALVTAAREPRYEMLAYSTQLIDVTDKVRPSMRLDEVIRSVRAIPFGGTYCALPIAAATASKAQVDAFVSYTDSETWDGAAGRGGYAGSVPDALRAYREASGIPARHVVVAVSSSGFTINDPADPLGLDVVGFDTATPAVIAEFVAGRM